LRLRCVYVVAVRCYLVPGYVGYTRLRCSVVLPIVTLLFPLLLRCVVYVGTLVVTFTFTTLVDYVVGCWFPVVVTHIWLYVGCVTLLVPTLVVHYVVVPVVVTVAQLGWLGWIWLLFPFVVVTLRGLGCCWLLRCCCYCWLFVVVVVLFLVVYSCCCFDCYWLRCCCCCCCLRCC